MHFHLRCVVLALAVSSSAAVPESCTIPAVNHGEVGNYLTKRLANTRSRECFYQLQVGEKIDDADSVILRCEGGYLPAGSPQTSKIRRLKEDVVTCEDGTWSKPLQCEAEITCGEPPPIEFATVTSLFPEDYPLGAIVAYECQPGHAIKGRSTTSKCVMSDGGSGAVWTKAAMSCTEVRCPAIDDKDIFTVRYTNDRKANSTAYYYCKEKDRKISGSNSRTCQEHGEWSGVDPECVVEAPASFPATTLSVTTAKTAGTISPPKSAPEKHSQTAAPEPSIAGSLDSQNRDPCCSTSDFLNTNVTFSDKGVKLLLGVKVKRGDRVQISCPDQTPILVWRNGLRASGPVNLTCDTCRTWDEEDIPSCVPRDEGDTWIVFNRKMKLLPGGIVEVRQHENIQILCSILKIKRQVNYPNWRTSPPKAVRVLYNHIEFERGFKLNTFLHIDDFKAELTGRYECHAEDIGSGHQYAATILNLKIAAPEVRCPILDEKDIFIINYNDSRKVNSIAVYFCRKQTQGPAGGNVRTCLENGEWTREEDPSCVDIVCPKLNDDLYVSTWYTNQQYVGSVATFYCRNPRIVIGISTSTCLGNGTWSHSQPACELPSVSRCPEIDGKGNFIINYSNGRRINSVAYYYCGMFSQRIHGSNTRTCQQNGEWTGSDPVCVEPDVRCPAIDDKGIFTVRYIGERKVNSAAYYDCKEKDDKMTGSNVRICQENGEWSGDDPECVLPSSSHCPEIDRKGNFIINYSNGRKINSVAYYYCGMFWQRIHGSNTRTCQQNGEWTGSDPVCVDITCREFVVSGSLTVFYTAENKEGSKAEFHCTPPAVLVGSFSARCLANGTWSSPQPSCVAPEIRCPEIDGKGVFRVTYSSDRKINSTVSYSCQETDHKLHGRGVRICQQNGEWSGDEPQCLPKDFDGCPLDAGNLSPNLEIEPMKEHYRLGDIVELYCRYGFELSPRLERIMCLGTEWSDEVPDCKKDELA